MNGPGGEEQYALVRFVQRVVHLLPQCITRYLLSRHAVIKERDRWKRHVWIYPSAV
jgi:hypothetical protein